MGKPTILPSLRSAAQKKTPLVKVGQSNVRVAWDSIDVLLGVYVLLVSGTPRCQLSPREISSLAGILPRHARTLPVPRTGAISGDAVCVSVSPHNLAQPSETH